jgi:hypothetical protein
MLEKKGEEAGDFFHITNERAGTLPRIEHGDMHKIRDTGEEPLPTLNLYGPPSYTQEGDRVR